MGSLQNILELISVYVASIDLKDAFYSVPLHKNHQTTLTFFAEKYLKFVCLPNRYGPITRIFTKISKRPFSILTEKGFKFIPTQFITYLGFNLNSVQMTITLTQEKKEKILNLCYETHKEDVVTIRFLSKLIGQLVAAFPAVTSGPLYYRVLEMNKAMALQLPWKL